MSSPPDDLVMLEVRNGDVCQFTTWMYRIARNARIDGLRSVVNALMLRPLPYNDPDRREPR